MSFGYRSGHLEHLKVGDFVHVKTYYQSYNGEVVKKGRKLVTVRYAGNRDDVFRMDTGRHNGESGSLRIYSLEQLEYNTRAHLAHVAIRSFGFDLRSNHDLTLEDGEKVIALLTALRPDLVKTDSD